MNDKKCLMCGSTRLIADSEKTAIELKEAYAARFGIDVERFLLHATIETFLCSSCGLRCHFGGAPGDSAFYDHMQQHKFYYEKEKPEFDYAIQQLIRMQPHRVLEVGCGEGNFLRKIRYGFEVRASELSEKSLGKLRSANIAMDTEEDRYDFICTFQVLEHVQEVEHFANFLVQKLSPNGNLLITVPNRDSKYISEGSSSILDYPPHHMTQWSRKALNSFADRYGFEVLDYYEEPMRIAHLAGLIRTRRAQVAIGKRLELVSRLFGRLMDYAMIPYYIDSINYAGHTHGVLLKRVG